MKLTIQEQKTVEYYDKHALKWARSKGMGESGSSFGVQMDQFCRYLPQVKILEIGSGHGRDAAELIARFGRNNYLGVDASASLIKLAKKRNPGAKFVQTTVYDLNFPPETFDGVWVSAVLLHLPKKRLGIALGKLNRLLKKSGVMFVSLLEGQEDMVNSRPGRWFSLYTKDEFRQALEAEGFKVEQTDKIETKESPWLTFIARKEGSWLI